MGAFINEFMELWPGLVTDVSTVIAGGIALWFVYAGIRAVLKVLNGLPVGTGNDEGKGD